MSEENMTSNDEGNTQKNEGVVEKVIKIFEKGWNKQVILYGPPGTSKTYSATIIAARFLAGSDCVDTQNPYNSAQELLKTINEQISNFAQTYPTNLKASSNEALLFMRRYRFANCSCFSCCFKDAYPSSNVQ